MALLAAAGYLNETDGESFWQLSNYGFIINELAQRYHECEPLLRAAGISIRRFRLTPKWQKFGIYATYDDLLSEKDKQWLMSVADFKLDNRTAIAIVGAALGLRYIPDSHASSNYGETIDYDDDKSSIEQWFHDLLRDEKLSYARGYPRAEYKWPDDKAPDITIFHADTGKRVFSDEVEKYGYIVLPEPVEIESLGEIHLLSTAESVEYEIEEYARIYKQEQGSSWPSTTQSAQHFNVINELRNILGYIKSGYDDKLITGSYMVKAHQAVRKHFPKLQ